MGVAKISHQGPTKGAIKVYRQLSIELSSCYARLHARNGAHNNLTWLHGRHVTSLRLCFCRQLVSMSLLFLLLELLREEGERSTPD
jgi:hypothetical protein